MAFRLVPLSTSIAAAPGETVVGRVEIHNDGSAPATFAVAVVGLDQSGTVGAGGALGAGGSMPVRVSIDAGASATVDVAITVPAALGIGEHAAAFEATSNRASDRAVLTPFTLSIASVERVELVTVPSTIRAHRRAKFHLDVTNREPQPVDVELVGDAPDVRVEFTPATARLLPGQRIIARGKVTGPRHWSGEPTQHNLLITARGRSSSNSITAPYVQRPVFAHRFRMVLAGLTVIALWLAAIGGVAFWLATRDEGGNADAARIIAIDTDGDGIPDAFFDADGRPVTAQDTDGDGIPDAFFDADGNLIPGTDTDGDGIPDTLVGSDGQPIVAVDTDGDGIPDALSDGSVDLGEDVIAAPAEAQPTILRGTVAIDGDPQAVAVTLTPMAVGTQPSPEATPIGIRGPAPEPPTGKTWSVRHGAITGISATVRRTVTVTPASPINPSVDGVFLFTDVLQGQSYEVSFALAGYDTQSFVVTPPADGQPVDLDVEMKPARGELSGSVVGVSGSKNAKITITDGTIEFQTTADSATGAWSIDGVSTPGVYTITAELRGYATAVRQVELGPGDRQSGIALEMVPGVGTITGRVIGTDGEPLGGVTVTATNGEITLTSTSLTEGNVGFFSLPQIDIPSTYTISATLDGYITQTRRLVLTGNATGVDFTMTSETTTLTGRVTSSAGGGIASAGLIVSTGELTFRASTSAGSNPGVFSIDRLPPGTYTITIEHYQHESATEFVTLVAGVTPPPLNVVLQRSSGPPAVGTGSLVVNVKNSDPTISPEDIVDATVTISRNRSGEAPRVLRDPVAASVRFDNLPVGTYTIRVTKDAYNPSQPITRSVGLQQQEVDVRMQLLGSASGRLVDAVDGSPILWNYFLSISRVNPNGTLTPVGTVPGQPTTGNWETDANVLQTGMYQIEVIQDTLPPGYVARNDQILVDRNNPASTATGPMRFVVPAVTNATAEPVELEPIKIDRLPTITGHVLKPRLDGGTNVAYDWIDATFNVDATCNGTAITGITMSSTGGDVGLDDTFTIAPADLAAAFDGLGDLPGTCDIDIGASGRVATSITLDNIDASNGATSTTPSTATDRLIATALARNPETLSGTMFWVDEGGDPAVRVPLPGTVRTSGDVIVEFVPAEATPTAPDPSPGVRSETLSTTVDGSGAWQLDGHLFGTATYLFESANFGTGQVVSAIDQNGRTFPVGTPSAAVVTAENGGFGVELRPPEPGTVNGTVRINTIVNPPIYPTDMVSGVDAAGDTHQTTPAQNGTYEFTQARAGTWTVNFATPPNHRLDAPPGGSASARLDPGGTLTFDAEFTELATVEVRLVDHNGDPITPDAGFELTRFANVSRPTGPPVNGVYEVSAIPVAATNAATTPVGYMFSLDVDEYDLKNATINGISADARAHPITLRAGERQVLEVQLDRYGTLTGTIVGTTLAADEPLSLDGANPATLTAERVNIFGVPAPLPDEPAAVVEPGPTAGTYRIVAPPGLYRLTVSHPEYQPLPAGSMPPDPSGGTVLPGIYVVSNNTAVELGDIRLQLRHGTLHINAVDSLATGNNVEGAVYDLYPNASSCSGTPQGARHGTITTGGISLTDMVPGSYCLAINKFDPDPPGERIAFTAIVMITIPRATATTPSETTVVAPLPALRPSLVGTLTAQNTSSTPVTVSLNASGAQVTSTFDDSLDIEVNGTTVPNENPDDGSRSATAQAPTPPSLIWTYTLEDVAFGTHTITAPDIEGYTLSTATQTVTVTGEFGPTDGPEFVYTVTSTPVEINLGTGVYPSLDADFPNDLSGTVRLTAPSGAEYTTFELDDSVAASPNLLVFADVAFEEGNFRLEFDDALHAAVNVTFTLSQALNTRDRRTGSITAPTADRVRLTGTVQQRTGSGANDLIDLENGAVLRLAGTSDYVLTPGPGTSSAGTWLNGANYAMDVPAGTYQLSLTQTGYVATSSTESLTVAGQLVTRNLQIDKLATVTVNATTNGLPAPAGLDLQMIDAANTVIDPSTEPSTFQVPAGTYRARARATNYPDQLSNGTTNLTIGQGSVTAVSIPITLPRYARVTVSGPPIGTSVTVAIGTASRTVTTTSASQTFEFTDTDATTTLRIPSTGALTANVSAAGYRPQAVNVSATIIDEQPVTLRPNVTVTGSIPGARDGDTVSVTNGTTTVSGTVSVSDGAATYSVAGLGIGAWELTYDVVGVGHTPTAATIATITATSPTGPTATGSTVTLTARTVDFDFVVTGTSGRLVGASVSLSSGQSGTTLADDEDTEQVNEAGTLTLTGPENATWTISHTNYLTRSGRYPLPASITLIPAITGTVVGGTGDDPVANAAVRICAATFDDDPCAGDDIIAATTSAATTGAFKFNTNLPAATYRVWVISGTAEVSRTLTVTATSATWGAGGGTIDIG